MNTSDGKWDQRFLELARVVAGWSKDRSTQVGCVIVSATGNVLSTGFNGFPRGCYDSAADVLEGLSHRRPGDLSPMERDRLRLRVEARHERPTKYAWTEHAERNAIYNAARNGTRLEGATVYVPWFPCTDCMRAIIQSGIAVLVCASPNFADPRWGNDFQLSVEMAAEAGLQVRPVAVAVAA
ncbi:CMP deaminase [archaeon]|nr:MAG: CMP deaminase [archaeon]